MYTEYGVLELQISLRSAMVDEDDRNKQRVEHFPSMRRPQPCTLPGPGGEVMRPNIVTTWLDDGRSSPQTFGIGRHILSMRLALDLRECSPKVLWGCDGEMDSKLAQIFKPRSLLWPHRLVLLLLGDTVGSSTSVISSVKWPFIEKSCSVCQI